LLIGVFAAVLITVFGALVSIDMLQRPIESVPLDAGWIGLLLIFVNGFFLSILLDKDKVVVIERLLLTTGLGFGLNFVLMIPLGVAWEISRLSVVLAQLIALITLGSLAFVRGFRPNANVLSLQTRNIQVNKQTVLQAFLIAIVSSLAILSFYNAISLPPTEWDSLAYGVNYARIMFQNGHIPLIAGPSIGIEMSAAYPPGVQVVATTLYTFAGNANDFYYRILSPIFSIAVLLVTYKFATALTKNRMFSVFAVSALSLVPYFWELFTQETYLMALTLMLTCCAYFFYKAHGATVGEVKKYEVLGVLFGAFAALTSYFGLFAFGILLIYSLHKKVGIKKTALLSAFGLAVILPWYFRNLVLLGSPIYPFFGVGKFLDPLLLSSTTQHFRHYTLDPLNNLMTNTCKIGAILLVVGILFFTFYKPRKELRLALPLYLLFAGVAVMAFHVAFPRYLIIALPTLAVLLAYAFTLLPHRVRVRQAATLLFMVLVILGSTVMLPYANTVKPHSQPGETRAEYVSRLFEEGDACQWINENTPDNARIATFDIKNYYLNRNVLSLDGNESAPLYHITGIDEALAFLQSKGVIYILSVPWASINDSRMPPAYNWCIITKYLGNTTYLPLVFIGQNGTAVYHVGPLDIQTAAQAFIQRNLVYPSRQFSVNVTITNSTYPYEGEAYLPIPVDYRGLNITASVRASVPLEVHLLRGITPNFAADTWFNSNLEHSPYGLPENTTTTFREPWNVGFGGYFTIRVIDKETDFQAPFNVTVNIAFTNP
jgi:hypothetical protein